MKLSIINRLYNAIPNGVMGPTALGASYITDKNGEILGHIDMGSGDIFVSESYEWKEQLAQRLDEQKLNYKFKDYEEF